MIAIKKIKSIITLYLAITVFLTGCMVGPDFKEPEMKIPDQYRFAPQDAKETVNLKWWELFNDPVLESLVITALNENKDLLIAIRRSLFSLSEVITRDSSTGSLKSFHHFKFTVSLASCGANLY